MSKTFTIDLTCLNFPLGQTHDSSFQTTDPLQSFLRHFLQVRGLSLSVLSCTAGPWTHRDEPGTQWGSPGQSKKGARGATKMTKGICDPVPVNFVHTLLAKSNKY